MLSSLVLLVATISITTAASLQYSLTFDSMLQIQYAFAQDDEDSDGSSNGSDDSTVEPTDGSTEGSSDSDAISGPSGVEGIGEQDSEIQCTGDFALDPTTGECDPTTGPCPEGETRGESGFCAVMPAECPPGTYIDEDPLCEPCPTEGQIPEACVRPDEIPQPQPEPEAEPEAEPTPLTNETNANQTGNTTFVTINNAIAQAFSSTTYNTRVLQQAAQNTLLIGEETVPLQGLVKANGTRLLSTFDPFKLIGGSAIIYLPTSNISSSPSYLPTSISEGSDKMQILALDGNTNQVVTLPSTEIPIGSNASKIVLGQAFEGTNPFTGEQVNVDNIKALFLFNSSNSTIAFGFGSNVALLTIVR